MSLIRTDGFNQFGGMVGGGYRSQDDTYLRAFAVSNDAFLTMRTDETFAAAKDFEQRKLLLLEEVE